MFRGFVGVVGVRGRLGDTVLMREVERKFESKLVSLLFDAGRGSSR